MMSRAQILLCAFFRSFPFHSLRNHWTWMQTVMSSPNQHVHRIFLFSVVGALRCDLDGTFFEKKKINNWFQNETELKVVDGMQLRTMSHVFGRCEEWNWHWKLVCLDLLFTDQILSLKLSTQVFPSNKTYRRRRSCQNMLDVSCQKRLSWT